MFQPERKFGVVVVGVGRAGSLRMRDLRSPHASSAFLNLIGFVSRCLPLLWASSLTISTVRDEAPEHGDFPDPGRGGGKP